MKIRLGYVAIALNLDKVTSSSTLTYSRYEKINSDSERINKLKEITSSNISALEKILRYNIENDIHFYRITSNLIPLATHPDVMWNYRKYFDKDFKYIGKIIKNSNMRVDAHPDQFNVINSDRESVVENTIKTLDMQVDLFEAMDNEEGKLVIHIGGAKGGTEVAINRFIENLGKFPSRIKERLILENEDKTFSVKDVLYISKVTNLPMVLDVHHHNCKNEGENISEFIGDVFDTWNQENIVPKIHFSTPREFINDRKHADYIDAKDFFDFIMLAKDYSNRDFDVMIEAKKKDIALFKLIDDLKILDKNIKFIDKTTIEI